MRWPEAALTFAGCSKHPVLPCSGQALTTGEANQAERAVLSLDEVQALLDA